MRVTGGLSDRRLLNQPASLPSWPASDLLLNSEVQVWVDADGLVLSPALLLPGSGSKEADHLALKLARAARFDPVARTAARLTSGVLVFEWHTVPQTNAVPATP
jgi:TonB family protein